ncbi:hypothetical protein CDAR_537651 [Caerostris darwini]|uniref:Sialin n=1 Tax=Caerostris darwini TaxID=1538125 RepID=A0AAV4X1A8_9ARAC|nr:hypothetical protein CDAR_537651 [Caerostris darwini]
MNNEKLRYCNCKDQIVYTSFNSDCVILSMIANMEFYTFDTLMEETAYVNHLEKNKMKPPDIDSFRCRIPKRLIVTFLGFFGAFNLYSMRIALSIAMVSMVYNNDTSSKNETYSFSECPVEQSEAMNTQTEFKGERYDWDSIAQNRIMSAFYYAYFVTMLLGGYIARRFGAHRVFGIGVCVSAVLTLLSPVTVRLGVTPFIILRVLQGMSEGVTFPTMTSLIAYWSPEFERSRISSVIFSGTWVGTVVSLSVSGWLCSLDFLGGWPSAFYVFGTISCIWFSLWCIFVYETPFKHPHISKQELLLFKDIQSTSKIIKMPWCDMLTSIPFWILLVAFIGQYFANIFLLLELPTYLNNVFHINVEKAGLLSALPCVMTCSGSWISSYMADRLHRTGKLELTTIRKLFNSISGYALSLAFIAIALSGCQFSVIVTLLCLGWFLNGSHMSGFNIVTVELCPDFSATVYGICNGIGSLTGIVAPNLVGVLTKSGPTVANWSKVFYITASLLSITTTLFALFASAEVQHWGEARYTKGIRKSQVNTSVAMETKNAVNI